MSSNAKVVAVSERVLHNDTSFATLLGRIGAVQSTAEGRRLIRHGMLEVNGQQMRDEQIAVAPCDLDEYDELQIKVGRDKYIVVFDDVEDGDDYDD